MRTKPKINKPKVPSKVSNSVIAKAPSKSGERTREHETRQREERYVCERESHGLDERRRLSDIEHASKCAHEKTLRDREHHDERCSFEHRSEREVGQAAARKERPMYSD